MDKSFLSEKTKGILDTINLPYMNMYYAGLRDGFDNVITILEECKKQGDEINIDTFINQLGKLVRIYDGNPIDDDKDLEDRDTAPKNFKEKGMSDEAFRALMNFKKKKKEEKEFIEELNKEVDDNKEEINSEPVEIDSELASLLHSEE